MDVKIDLIHNSILQQTVSEAFASSVQEQLLPLLTEQYGDSLSAIQMYEDHLSDELLLDGYWYYPMTAVLDGVPQVVWIRWLFHKGAYFPTGIPYDYAGGEPLLFELVETPPADFVERVAGRDIWFEGGYIPLTVQAAAADPVFLSGKYSQAFVDEMTRQLHEAIGHAASVEGLAESGIELSLIFAPESYMEHTSENVTYRRLLMTARGCAPRDFWIKWTRLNSAVAYSVSEHVQRDSIVFSLGEDVPHKVREKEYRFLVGHNTDKYQCAMGRRNITEWRDLIKRAIKRGELTHRDHPTLLSEAADPLYDRLSAILDRYGVATPAAEPVETAAAPREGAEDETLRLVREAVDREQSCTEAYTPTAEDLVGEITVPELTASVTEEPAATDEPPIVAESVPVMTAAVEQEVAQADLPPEPAVTDGGDVWPEDDDRQPQAADDAEDTPDAWERQILDSHQQMEENYRHTEEQMRAELEAQIRLEYESRARREAEEAAERLRAEKEQLRLENERLAAEARRAEERRLAEEEARRAEEARLRAQIESSQRAEARERERAAEAARLALEQSQRMEAERREREEQLEAERRRREEERAAREAELMRAEARRLEEERRLAEEQERQREREAALARAEEARRRAEQEARQRAEADRALRVGSMETVTDSDEPPIVTPTAADLSVAGEATPVPAEEPIPAPGVAEEEADDTFDDRLPPTGRGDYSYTSRVVDLLFRHPVDPNVTGRIHEIIAITLDYFHKSDVYMRVKATIPEGQKVVLNFVEFPEEEMELLINIIKVLGNSDLGIMKIILE